MEISFSAEVDLRDEMIFRSAPNRKWEIITGHASTALPKENKNIKINIIQVPVRNEESIRNPPIFIYVLNFKLEAKWEWKTQITANVLKNIVLKLLAGIVYSKG